MDLLRMNRAARSALAGLICIWTSACFDSPLWTFDHYEVSGSFGPNHLCRYHVNDGPDRIGYTRYTLGGVMNVGLDDSPEDLHSVFCKDLIVSFRAPRGGFIVPGKYPIEGVFILPISRGRSQAEVSDSMITTGWWPTMLDVAAIGYEGEAVVGVADTAEFRGAIHFKGKRWGHM